MERKEWNRKGGIHLSRYITREIFEMQGGIKGCICGVGEYEVFRSLSLYGMIGSQLYIREKFLLLLLLLLMNRKTNKQTDRQTHKAHKHKTYRTRHEILHIIERNMVQRRSQRKIETNARGMAKNQNIESHRGVYIAVYERICWWI